MYCTRLQVYIKYYNHILYLSEVTPVTRKPRGDFQSPFMLIFEVFKTPAVVAFQAC